MTVDATPDLHGFRAVDGDAASAVLVEALEEQAALPAVQRLRAAAIDHLAPRRGQRLVDVGCGLGDVARALAVLVGPEGSVVGIDPSHTMRMEALRRTVGRAATSLELRAGDAEHLELDDASVDGAYCERVLQHLDAPDVAVRELTRVTRPFGRIVVIDTDWGMHAIDGADPELTERVLACWTHQAANGWSGRRLSGLFVRAGLREPVAVAETITITDPLQPTRPPITTMAAAAAQTGALEPAEARRWLTQLTDAAAGGQFFWAVTMFAVAATRGPTALWEADDGAPRGRATP